MVLRCQASVEDKVTWTVPEQVSKTRYSTSDGARTLTVSSVHERDSGESHMMCLCLTC